VLLRGTLKTASGAAIAGARIDIAVRSSRPGSAAHARYATTDEQGRFTYRLPVGSSRLIDAGYRAFTLDAAFAATARTRLRVRAAATLAAKPRRLGNHERVRFRGRLLGGPFRRDASMILYALAGRRRIPVTPLRPDSRGRFAYSYRFQTVTSTTRFRFQVRIDDRPSYPYVSGRSNTVTVVVRP
jgi:hypothetical protein